MNTTQTPLTWQPLWDAMRANPAQWIPTTEQMFWDMLEVLPPRLQGSSAFLVGEADHHNNEGRAVYACFCKIGSQYRAKYMTTEQFRSEAM